MVDPSGPLVTTISGYYIPLNQTLMRHFEEEKLGRFTKAE